MQVNAKKLELSGKTNTYILAAIAVGIATFVAGLLTDPVRIWNSYLLHHTLFMGLGFGALFFLVIHYLASSGWVVGLRRVPEAMSSYLIAAFVFTMLILLGLKQIYPWMDVQWMHDEHVLHHKVTYFAPWFFALRIVVFFVAVLAIAHKIVGNSLKQDEEGGVARSNSQRKLGAIFLVTFAPLFTVFTVDVYKSLDPKWFSTMWGVYMFIGFVQASVATMILIIGAMKKQGYLENVTEEHHHDLGKYMFGFSIFWAYIAVSQYLLIWYANQPEETTFFLARQSGGWLYISLLLPIVRFLLPFALLLPRANKRNPKFLRKVACIVLIGAWIDLNWIIMPVSSPEGFQIGWQDLGLLIGFAGAFMFMVRRFLSKNNTVPVKDPYLHESLHHHVA